MTTIPHLTKSFPDTNAHVQRLTDGPGYTANGPKKALPTSELNVSGTGGLENVNNYSIEEYNTIGTDPNTHEIVE